MRDVKMRNMNGWSWDIPDLLSREEEDDLAKKSWGGDLNASARLAGNTMRLIISTANSMSGSKSDTDDLVGEGLYGAWVAALRYDPSYGVRFCTYAAWWIRAFMVKYLKQSSKFMKELPGTFRVEKELWRAYSETGKAPDDASVQKTVRERVGVSQKRLEELIYAAGVRKVSFDVPPCDDAPAIGETIASDLKDPEEDLELRQEHEAMQRDVASALSVLSEREAKVVMAVINGSFEIAGKEIGVTRQRAHQINDKAIRKMRGYLKRQRWNSHESSM